MAKAKVTVKFEIRKLVDQILDDTTKADIGNTIVDDSKQFIASGQSPVRGVGRFDAYKGVAGVRNKTKKTKPSRDISSKKEIKSKKSSNSSAISKKKVYPFSVQDKFPDKKVRPVNLNLSGKMLSYLDWKDSKKDTIVVGMVDAPSNIQDIADAHQNGSNKNVPQRQFLPKENESFAVTIMNKIKKIYEKRLSVIIKDSNRKK